MSGDGRSASDDRGAAAPRTTRAAIVLLSALAALLLALLLLAAVWNAGPDRWVGNTLLKIGGPFTLQTTDGRRFSDMDVAGRPFAIYFGFTFCPDLCPTTLAQLSAAREAMGAEGAPLRLLFVSVDPERDTRQALADYESAFPGVTALTGSPEALRAAAATFRASFRRVALPEGGYTIDHTASALLFDGDGRYAGSIGHDAADDEVAEKLRALVVPDAAPRWRWPAVLGGH